ncbi:uncharacterized protein LOC132195483 [Neocloeon triangulifer]|uniref:uncharacterized protein LOC132195483 n=1 Tax=Neocloeon triangulifer TaxID=2078957 RepID=UPI00286F7514|nr:uncharacterized protein LOC132195483 [Neocloeon triangulifer]
MVVDAQGFSDVFNKLPGIVQQLQDLANNPGSRYNPQPNNDAFEMSILDDDPQNVEVEPDSGLGSLVFPSDMNEKWKIFDERVAQLRSKPDDEFKYALVHTENGANLYDLGKPFEQEGVFFASKTLLARAVNNSKEVHSYAVQALEAFFRHDVAFFCTCTGSSKGQSPDGHARAGLPDKPLQIFIAHCIRLARKKSWKLQKTDKDTRTFLVRKINIFLNNQRHNYGFDPTEEQLKEYNKKMGRGSEFAKKRKNNPSAEEELEEDIL